MMLGTLVDIAAEAAQVVMDVYQKPFSVDYKGPSDPVTAADRLANELICRRLEEAFPGIPVVAEESPEERWEHFRESDRVFFVDPVDGTREFVARNGQFVVMIGLVVGATPSLGVLHAPALNHVWAGEVGKGAFFVDETGARRTLPPLVDKQLDDAVLVSSTSKRRRVGGDEVERLGLKGTFSIGSAGLKTAALADGRADVYYAKKHAGCLWDTCAPEAIVRALEGRFTDATGRDLDYRAPSVTHRSGAVAAASDLHARFMARLRDT